jgi:hypothetical protein
MSDKSPDDEAETSCSLECINNPGAIRRHMVSGIDGGGINSW